jgi:hypothetical protein
MVFKLFLLRVFRDNAVYNAINFIGITFRTFDAYLPVAVYGIDDRWKPILQPLPLSGGYRPFSRFLARSRFCCISLLLGSSLAAASKSATALS